MYIKRYIPLRYWSFYFDRLGWSSRKSLFYSVQCLTKQDPQRSSIWCVKIPFSFLLSYAEKNYILDLIQIHSSISECDPSISINTPVSYCRAAGRPSASCEAISSPSLSFSLLFSLTLTLMFFFLLPSSLLMNILIIFMVGRKTLKTEPHLPSFSKA